MTKTLISPDFTPATTALLVIDMQADFYAPFGNTVKRGKQVSHMQQIAPQVSHFAKELAKQGVLVFFTKFISGKSITPMNLQSVAQKVGYDLACAKGSGMEELHDVTVPLNAIVLEKPHYDAFAYTNLHKLLTEKGVRTVLVTGVRTEICVDATAKRAATEGFETVIVKDLVATYDDRQALHDQTLNIFDKFYGYVMTSKDILAKYSQF